MEIRRHTTVLSALLLLFVGLLASAGAVAPPTEASSIAKDSFAASAGIGDPQGLPPVTVEVFEAFGFGGQVQVLPPVDVSVYEAFGFADDPRVVPPTVVQVFEGFGFSDATQISVLESEVVVALKNIEPEDIRLISMGFDLPPIETDPIAVDVFVRPNSPNIGGFEFNGAPVSDANLLSLGAIACTSPLAELVQGSRLKQLTLSYSPSKTGFNVNPVPPEGLEVATDTEFIFDKLFLSGSFRSQAIIAFGTSCPSVLGGG